MLVAEYTKMPKGQSPGMAKSEGFPQPLRRDGKEPCGECRLQKGETCDICGAKQDDDA